MAKPKTKPEPKLRTILTTPIKGSVPRAKVRAAIRKVMAERDEETIKLLNPPEDWDKLLKRRRKQ